jgi:hypothetical protein
MQPYYNLPLKDRNKILTKSVTNSVNKKLKDFCILLIYRDLHLRSYGATSSKES